MKIKKSAPSIPLGFEVVEACEEGGLGTLCCEKRTFPPTTPSIHFQVPHQTYWLLQMACVWHLQAAFTCRDRILHKTLEISYSGDPCRDLF